VGERAGSRRDRPARRNPSIRRREAFGAIAAAAIAVVGAVAVTNAVDHPSSTTTAQLAESATLRFGTLTANDGHPVGNVYVHEGDPSWVFMKMHATGSAHVRAADTTLVCELKLANGTAMPIGTVTLHDGVGQLAHSVRVDVSQIRGAKLVTPEGSTLASTSFA
ncbi:MAG: hypothetical protein ACRD1G_18985, partial [Acidimicrobiales bacterium]